jgi:ABC-type glycerol-3-phosphate transport system substrate-binding protein
MKSFRLLAAGIVVALAATACGGDDEPSTPGTGTDLSGQTLEVAAVWSGTEQKNFQAVLDAFTERTKATVKYTTGGNDLPVLLNSRIAGGSPPDVALIAQPGVVAELAGRGAVKELTGDAAAAVNANYSDAWKQLGTIDGKLYGAYFKVANKSVIWYRQDAFDSAGVQPPATWDELKTTSQTLADAGTTPMAVAGGDGWVLTDWFENVYLRVGGPDNYDKLSRHELPWTDPTVVETLTLLADYWRTRGLIQGGPSGAVQVTFTQSIADVFGEKPKSAMLFEGDFVGAEITGLGKMTVGQEAKFFNFPSVKNSPAAVVTAGDQAVALKDTPAAMAFMAFLASPEAADIMTAKGGFISANKNGNLDTYTDPTTRQLAEAVINAEQLRFDMSDLTPQAFGGNTSAHMWVLLQDFLSKGTSPQETAQKLEDAAKQDFKK